MDELFSRVCKIVFTFEDGSTILCETTLNQELLNNRGFNEVNGFVDLSSGRIIPEELFDLPFEILPHNTNPNRTSLDTLFDIGGKIHWSTATL